MVAFASGAAFAARDAAAGLGGGFSIVDAFPAVADAKAGVGYVLKSDPRQVRVLGTATVAEVPAVPGVPAGADTPAQRDIYANNAETAGMRIFLLDPSGVAGNAWTFVRGLNNGALRFERIADVRNIRLAGEIFNNVTTFGQIRQAAEAVDFVRTEYFGGTNDASTANGNILIPGGGGLFHGGADGAAAIPGIPAIPARDVPALVPISAFTGLGPEQNTFGDDTTVDDAAARGLLDAYAAAAANADWLAAYNGNLSFLVKLQWDDGFQFLRRNSTGIRWETANEIIQGPPGEDANLAGSLAAQAASEAARDASRVARDESVVAQGASEGARDESRVARDASQAAQQAAEAANGQADFNRNAAQAQAVAAQGSAIEAGVQASAAGVSAGEADAARIAAEAARDAAQAQAGFTESLRSAVSDNTETGIDVSVDANGKLNFEVTGGGVPPVAAHARYAALTLNEPAVAADFTDDDYGADSDTEDIQLPVFAENRYLAFTRRADLPDPTFIGVRNGQNQIGAFIQLGAAHNVQLGDPPVAEAQWQHVDGNGEAEQVYPVLSGTVWTIR